MTMDKVWALRNLVWILKRKIEFENKNIPTFKTVQTKNEMDIIHRHMQHENETRLLKNILLRHLRTVGMRVIRIQNQYLEKCPNLLNLDSNVLYFDNKSHLLK